jgi:glycopeptide antibiotics resistance protein
MYSRVAPHPTMMMGPQPPAPSTQWSNRILIVAMMGIVYLTLFPFRFDFSSTLPGSASPFLLGPSSKHSIGLDFFLNLLLFVPFGIGLTAQLRKWGVSRTAGVALALAGGILVSYLIELLQIYVPGRSSGWDDVFSNSTGSVVGFLLFELCGNIVFSRLSKYENAIRSWMSPNHAAVVLLLYFCIWFGISIFFQEKTRLSNWDDQSSLLVGNDFSTQHPWKGKIFLIQMWSRAFPEEHVHQIMAGSAASGDSDLLAWPALTWQPSAPSAGKPEGLELDGQSWPASRIPMTELARKIRGTNQFTLRITCAPAESRGATGRIVSISQSQDVVNLNMRQDGTSLTFWFRNPLSVRRAALTWYVPGVFQTQATRDILVSYDGSNASVYVDGKKVPRTYRLSPGASLAQRFVILRTDGLQGYIVVYATLIFIPAGMLIGWAGGNCPSGNISARLILGLFLFLPPVLLELLLVRVSGRGILFDNMILSLFFAFAGCLLINSDGVPMASREGTAI